jgi:hypothetical protein
MKNNVLVHEDMPQVRKPENYESDKYSFVVGVDKISYSLSDRVPRHRAVTLVG